MDNKAIKEQNRREHKKQLIKGLKMVFAFQEKAIHELFEVLMQDLDDKFIYAQDYNPDQDEDEDQPTENTQQTETLQPPPPAETQPTKKTAKKPSKIVVKSTKTEQTL